MDQHFCAGGGKSGGDIAADAVGRARDQNRLAVHLHVESASLTCPHCACAPMPAALMIGHHLSISAFWNAASPSGVCCSRGATSSPNSVNRFWISRIGQRFDGRGVELGDDVLRRPLRREEAEPARHIKSGHAGLVRGRNVRHRGRALRRQVGERLDLAAADLRQRHRALHDQQVHRAGDKVGHGRARAAIGNELHFLLGKVLEQHAGDIRRRVLVDEIDLAGVRLHPGHEFGKGVGRKVILGDHELGIVGDQADRLEILFEIVIELVDDAADMGVPLADVEGVAVRRRAGDAPDPDAAAGAADIFDHDRLPERRAHALRHDAGGGVGRSARREWHHQRHRTRRIGLRLRAGDAGNNCQRQRNQKFSHDFPPGVEVLVFSVSEFRPTGPAPLSAFPA